MMFLNPKLACLQVASCDIDFYRLAPSEKLRPLMAGVSLFDSFLVHSYRNGFPQENVVCYCKNEENDNVYNIRNDAINQTQRQ